MRTSLVDLLYPPACLLCRRSTRLSRQDLDGEPHAPTRQEPFCQSCEEVLPVLLPPACQRCGVGLRGAYDATLVCRHCQHAPLAFERACAPFVYEGLMREAIQAFKYQRHHRIGRWLADRMAVTADRQLPLADITLIVPVPLHWVKRCLKGTNPAALLARAVSKLLQRPYAPAGLRRVRWTPTQTRLTRSQRLRNVRGCFAASGPSLAGRTILLVDDVLTSGATAQACARALQAHGAARVLVLTAARALPE